MLVACEYLTELTRLIKQVQRTQQQKLTQAAKLVTDAIVAEKTIFLWGPGGHSSIFAEDALYRKGELAQVCPIYDPNISLSHGAAREINGMERLEGFGEAIVRYHRIGKDDVVILGSAYGINPVAIQGALECRRIGAHVISITSPAFSDASNYAGAKHQSGCSLYSVSDIYIDSCVPYGDAILEVKGFDHKISPVATIMQAIVLKALLAEVMSAMMEKGHTPVTWTNSLQEGGIQANSGYMKAVWGRIKGL